MYKFILQPLLFLMDAEKAHHFTFSMLKFIHAIPGVSALTKATYRVEDKALERELFGLKFPNPIGLAAGFDKDAKLFNELHNYGFGFIEIGTLTPKPQPGNPKKRLFRLKKDKALINRMGFNNGGVEQAVERLKKRRPGIIVGGNIGKNKATPNEEAVNDYLICFKSLYDYVDYFVVNVSSPNTPNLRELQEKEPLKMLLSQLMTLNHSYAKPKPILLKIAPDLTETQLDDIIEIVNETKIQGVIATNTTIDRSGLLTTTEELEAIGAGGLSGKPVTRRSTEVIRYLAEKSGKSFPIIGVGGVHSAADAVEKLDAGADLVQVYTGFIYEGPSLVKKINRALIQRNKLN
jgi:dihydroorotate dehydrogenase